MYAPSKYGGGVVCVCWMEGCVCVCDGGGEGWGEGGERDTHVVRKEEGDGHVLLLTSRKFSPMTLER